MYLHWDDVSLLAGDVGLGVSVLADQPVNAAVAHLGVARARQVHRKNLHKHDIDMFLDGVILSLIHNLFFEKKPDDGTSFL